MRRGSGGGGRLAPAAVLFLVALVTLVACSGGTEAPERAATDAARRTTSTTVAPSPRLERVTASPSVLDDGAESRFTDVVVGTRAIVVIGESDGEAAIWTTFDGAFYEEAVLDAAQFPPGTVLTDLVATNEGFVVVGSAGGQGAAWVSFDGRAWLRTGLAGGDVVDVVIVGELGISAFGRDREALAVWTSFDGAVWERVPGGGGVFDDRPGEATVVGAYDDGDGFVAIVERAGVAEAWRSSDGRSWAPDPVDGAELLPAEGVPMAEAVLGAGSTMVVLGAVEAFDGIDAAVWTSLAGEPWERTTPSEAVFGGDGAQVARAAVQLGSDLVVVGTDTDDAGDVDAVVWSTGGGGGWRRAPEGVGDGLSGAGDQYAVDIAVTRDGALVVGWETVDGATRAMAWTLVSGGEAPVAPVAGPALGWRRLAPSEALGGVGEQRMDDVIATADGFLAVGASTSGARPGDGLDAAVWRSADGVEWERVDAPAFGGPGDQRLLGVAAVDGRFVAVGADRSGAAVWTSGDGVSWALATVDPTVFDGPGDQVATAVAAGPDDSVVVVGDGGDGQAGVWRSQGVSAAWQRVAPSSTVGATELLTDVGVVGPLLVAVGAGDAGAVAWTSLDGVAWERSVLGAGRAEAVVAVGGGAVAVGSVGASGGQDVGGQDAAAWRSDDGRSWEPVPIDDGDLAAADQQLLDVAATTTAEGGQLLAGVGWTGFGPGDDGAAWASEDGAEWFRTPHDEDVFGGDQAQRMQALATAEDVSVAVGWSGSTPEDRNAAVWITAPGGGGGGVL